jgi:type IV secretory pathway VirJ component
VLPELTKLRGLNMQCFYGEEDSDTLCRDLPPDLARVYSSKSGHRFGKNFNWIVDAILGQIPQERPETP